MPDCIALPIGEDSPLPLFLLFRSRTSFWMSRSLFSSAFRLMRRRGWVRFFGLFFLRKKLTQPRRRITLEAEENAERDIRSEEHTSELQSPDHALCRLPPDNT